MSSLYSILGALSNLMIVNNGGPNRLLRGIYGGNMEDGVISPFSASFYRREPGIAFSSLGVALDFKNRYHSAPDSFFTKHLYHGHVFQERRLAVVQPLYGQ